MKNKTRPKLDWRLDFAKCMNSTCSKRHDCALNDCNHIKRLPASNFQNMFSPPEETCEHFTDIQSYVNGV